MKPLEIFSSGMQVLHDCAIEGSDHCEQTGWTSRSTFVLWRTDDKRFIKPIFEQVERMFGIIELLFHLESGLQNSTITHCALRRYINHVRSKSIDDKTTAGRKTSNYQQASWSGVG